MALLLLLLLLWILSLHWCQTFSNMLSINSPSIHSNQFHAFDYIEIFTRAFVHQLARSLDRQHTYTQTHTHHQRNSMAGNYLFVTYNKCQRFETKRVAQFSLLMADGWRPTLYYIHEMITINTIYCSMEKVFGGSTEFYTFLIYECKWLWAHECPKNKMNQSNASQSFFSTFKLLAYCLKILLRFSLWKMN